MVLVCWRTLHPSWRGPHLVLSLPYYLRTLLVTLIHLVLKLQSEACHPGRCTPWASARIRCAYSLSCQGHLSLCSRGFRSQSCTHKKGFSSDTAITLTLPDSNASVSVLYDAIQQQFDDETREGFKFTAGCWVLVAQLSSGFLPSAGAMLLPCEFYGDSLVSDLEMLFRVDVSALLPVRFW